MNYLIESLPETFNYENTNVIKCLYEIKKEDVNKDVKIYENISNIEGCIKSVSIYKEYIKKETIKNGIYRFKKKGKYLIYYMPSLINNKIESINNLFNGCMNLEEINFPKIFNTNNVTNMSNFFMDVIL